jgi:hypothetical protein
LLGLYFVLDKGARKNMQTAISKGVLIFACVFAALILGLLAREAVVAQPDLSPVPSRIGMDYSGSYTALLPFIGHSYPPKPPLPFASYTVTIPDPKQRRAIIRGYIAGLDTDKLVLARPYAWLPLLPPVDLTVIQDQAGNPLVYSYSESGAGQDGDETYTIDVRNASAVSFEYEVDLTTLSGEYGHGNAGYWYFKPDEYLMIESHILFLQPISLLPKRATVSFELPADWQAVTRLQQVGASTFQADMKDVTLYGSTHDAYTLWGPLGLGIFDVYADTAGGVEFIVAIPPDNDDIGAQVAQQRFAVNRYISANLWQLGKGSSLRFINIYPAPDPTLSVSSRDHCYGDFRWVGPEPDIGTRYDLTHVTFHQWFVHGGLEYPAWEVMYPDMWAEEGLNDYFARRTNFQVGLVTLDQFHDELIEFYMEYRDVILDTPFDVPLTDPWDMPLEPSQVLWYKKGALVNYILDERVRGLTSGTKSIEDVFRYLHNRRPSSDRDRITAEDMLTAYNYITGGDLSDLFDRYIHGTDPLPLGVLEGRIRPVWDGQFPQVAATAAPTSGSVRLVVAFSGEVEDDGQILAYEWDFNGDKVFDWQSSTGAATTYSYVTGGGHIATLRVTDDDGLMSEDSVVITISGPSLPSLSVTADGNPSEWGAIPPLIPDPANDTSGYSGDLAGLSVAMDGGYLCLMLSFHDTYDVDSRVNSFLIRNVTQQQGYQIRVAEPGYPLLRIWQETESGAVEVDASALQGGAGEVVELKIPIGVIGSPENVELSASVGTVDYQWYDQTAEMTVKIPH